MEYEDLIIKLEDRVYGRLCEEYSGQPFEDIQQHAIAMNIMHIVKEELEEIFEEIE